MSGFRSATQRLTTRLDDLRVLFSAAAFACLLGGWSLGRELWGLAAAALVLAGAMIFHACRNQMTAERLVARLCGDEDQIRYPFAQSLARLAQQLDGVEHRMANSHPVTRLPTRELLCEAVTADIAAGAGPQLMGAIRFADFDRLAAFDEVAANQALKVFARRLAEAARSHHAIGQIDRDCFAIWFREGGLEDAAAEFRALAYVARQDIEGGEAVLAPTIEAGTVSFPRDGEDATSLLRRLSVALIRLGRSGASDLPEDEAPSVETVRDQFTLEQDLARAIPQNELSMVFQPVVDLSAKGMVGAEALLRWEHPTLGPVSPARFIPIVESIGLSERFGLWVLNFACREAKRWQQDGLSGLRVAVNLSARQLLDPGLLQKIERTLQRHGLSPTSLELELTETAAMANAERTFALFGELRAMGISIAIDDFGSGYSSLSYLKNLPFDKIKIDREFVTDLDQRRDSRAICKALIELGRGLDLKVLAEGVETADEVKALRSLGCNVFQGYYYAKPLPAEELRRLAGDPSWRARFTGANRRSTILESRVSL